MNKPIWSEPRFDFSVDPTGSDDYAAGAAAINRAGLGAARGLLIGLAISQMFWIAIAIWLIR